MPSLSNFWWFGFIFKFVFPYKTTIASFGRGFALRLWDVAGMLLGRALLWDLTPPQTEVVGQLVGFPAG